MTDLTIKGAQLAFKRRSRVCCYLMEPGFSFLAILQMFDGRNSVEPELFIGFEKEAFSTTTLLSVVRRFTAVSTSSGERSDGV